MDKNVIDVDEAMERVQDDKELFLELLDIFQGDYEEKRPGLMESVKSNNADQIRDVAHSIKGAAGNISAKQIQSCCAEIELLAEKNELDNIQQKIDGLQGAYEKLKVEISEIKETMSEA